MGLVARVVELMGIPTINVSTGRDITALVRPPRSLFVNFPMGNSFGQAGDQDMQNLILRRAFDLAVNATEPGVIEDLEIQWPEVFEYYAGDTSPEAIARQMKKD